MTEESKGGRRDLQRQGISAAISAAAGVASLLSLEVVQDWSRRLAELASKVLPTLNGNKSDLAQLALSLVGGVATGAALYFVRRKSRRD